jgi:hypothetical protein
MEARELIWGLGGKNAAFRQLNQPRKLVPHPPISGAVLFATRELRDTCENITSMIFLNFLSSLSNLPVPGLGKLPVETILSLALVYNGQYGEPQVRYPRDRETGRGRGRGEDVFF